jgi:hypothetical protein
VLIFVPEIAKTAQKMAMVFSLVPILCQTGTNLVQPPSSTAIEEQPGRAHCSFQCRFSQNRQRNKQYWMILLILLSIYPQIDTETTIGTEVHVDLDQHNEITVLAGRLTPLPR